MTAMITRTERQVRAVQTKSKSVPVSQKCKYLGQIKTGGLNWGDRLIIQITGSVKEGRWPLSGSRLGFIGTLGL
jgi:hypothetical protein